MTSSHSEGPNRFRRLRGALAAQLKGDIDRGATGDKVGGFDPAAAPLGTDDEAGGVSPWPELVALDRIQERSFAPRRAAPNAATPELAPDGSLPPQPLAIFAIPAGVALAVVLGAILLAAL
jgi:hypothetical protein